MRILFSSVFLVAITGCDSELSSSALTSSTETALDSLMCPNSDCELAVGIPAGVTTGSGDGEAHREEIPCNGEDEDLDGTDLCGGDADLDGVPSPIDCDDANSSISQLANEILCDGIDQNCDGIDDCDSDSDGIVDRLDCAPEDPTLVQCLDPSSAHEPLE